MDRFEAWMTTASETTVWLIVVTALASVIVTKFAGGTTI
jgi:hypothetical protein